MNKLKLRIDETKKAIKDIDSVINKTDSVSSAQLKGARQILVERLERLQR